MFKNELFINRIKLLRSEKGITQRDLAEALDITAGTIGMYESGKRLPSLEVLVNMANFFKVTIDYLIGNSDSRSGQNETLITELGLSDESIDKLISFKNHTDVNLSAESFVYLVDVINDIIESRGFEKFISDICSFILMNRDNFVTCTKDINKSLDNKSMKLSPEVLHDAYKSRMSVSLENIVHEIEQNNQLFNPIHITYTSNGGIDDITFTDKQGNFHSIKDGNINITLVDIGNEINA